VQILIEPQDFGRSDEMQRYRPYGELRQQSSRAGEWGVEGRIPLLVLFVCALRLPEATTIHWPRHVVVVVVAAAGCCDSGLLRQELVERCGR